MMEAGSTHSLSTLAQNLQQSLQQSTTLRLKYPSEPLKFYPPQQSINQVLDTILQQIASLKNYPKIADSHVMLPVLRVLQHPNCDLICKAIDIIHEFVVQGVPGQNQNEQEQQKPKQQQRQDQDQQNKDRLYQIYFRLCLWLQEKGMLTALAALVGESGKAVLDEDKPQDYETVLKILKIFQTLIEMHGSIAQQLISQKKDPKILYYLCDRIMPNFRVQSRIIDDNKFIASDVLVLFLQQSQTAQTYFLKMRGIQILVECLRPYTQTDPKLTKDKLSKNALNRAFYTDSSDQYEYVSNIFDCLNIVINPDLSESVASQFHIFDGSRLMVWFLKQKNEHSVLAFKVLKKSLASLRFPVQDAPSSSSQPTQYLIVQDLINHGLLKYLFAVLVRQGLRGKDVDQQLQIDENCLDIIYLLCRAMGKQLMNSNPNMNAGVYRDRVINKFTEERCKKLEQIFQLYEQYRKRVQEISEDIALDKALQNQDKTVLNGQQPKDAGQYLIMIKQGQSILQLITKIILQLYILCNEKYHSSLRKRIIQLLIIYNFPVQSLIHNLKMHLTFLTDLQQRPYVERLLAKVIPILGEEIRSNSISEDQSKDGVQKTGERDQQDSVKKKVKLDLQNKLGVEDSVRSIDDKILRPKK